MRAIQIFLNGEFMGSTTLSGLPALQNMCQTLNLDQNWAEEEKAFYISTSDPVAQPDPLSTTHLSIDADEFRVVLYPDPSIVLPPSTEPAIETEVESPGELPVVSVIEPPELLDPSPVIKPALRQSSASDPRTPPGSGAVFTFRRASLSPGEALDYPDDPLIANTLPSSLTNPPDWTAQIETEPLEEPTEPQVATLPKPPADPELLSRPLNPPLRSARRRTPPPRVHAQATRIIQSGATVIRI